MSRLLTYQEAAELAQVSSKTIQRRADSGDLERVQRGGRSLVTEVSVRTLYALPPPPPAGPCRVIAVANQKGGVGKTSTCANLAAALSQTCRVLAVDCDPQGNLTQTYNTNPDALSPTLYECLTGDIPLRDAIKSPVLSLANLSLVGANLDLAAAEQQLSNALAREFLLKEKLAPVLPVFDFIILDCPPALGILTINALMACTEVIIPVDTGTFALRGVGKLQQTIDAVRRLNPAMGRVRALSNRADGTNISVEVREQLQAAFGSDLIKTVIRRNVRVVEAQAAKLPVIIHSPNSPASRDYLILAEEIKNG